MQAVLTGDIVGSSDLSPADHRRVIGLVKSVGRAYPDAVVGAVDVFSGDSWQILVSDCGLSLRIAVYLRAILKREKGFSIDSRISIAWGDVDEDQIDLERISESTGDVFTASGRGLVGLKKASRMCFCALHNDYLSVAVGGLLGLIDVLVRQWSKEQARAVSETLMGKTQAAIASEFDIGQSAVNKSLQAANWVEIANAFDAVDQLLKITPQGDN